MKVVAQAACDNVGRCRRYGGRLSTAGHQMMNVNHHTAPVWPSVGFLITEYAVMRDPKDRKNNAPFWFARLIRCARIIFERNSGETSKMNDIIWPTVSETALVNYTCSFLNSRRRRLQAWSKTHSVIIFTRNIVPFGKSQIEDFWLDRAVPMAHGPSKNKFRRHQGYVCVCGGLWLNRGPPGTLRHPKKVKRRSHVWAT